MNRVPSRAIPVLCCLALAGCVKPVDCTTTDKLSVGTSTIQDAKALLGEPANSSPAGNGTTLVRWEYTTHANVGGGTFTTMLLTFGQDGKLMSKSCNTLVVPQRVQEPAGG